MWETYDMGNEDFLWAGIPFNGGISGHQQAPCGAVSASAVFLGLRHRCSLTDKEKAKQARNTIRLQAGKLVEDFNQKFGDITCRGLLGLDFNVPGEYQKFLESGKSKDTCEQYVLYVIEKLYSFEQESRNQKQNRKTEILVIGPEPPCVRCLNTHKFAKDIAQQFPGETIEVRRIFSHSEEAQKYGKVEGGHAIAKREQVKADVNKLLKLVGQIDELERDEESNEGLIEAKLSEVDTELAPLIQKAEEIGSLMTPVLIINGKVKSMGYVPRKEQIREWIESELKG